jgi:hypothetical protein
MLILRIALFAAVVAMACPIRFHVAGAGLDQSWAFALNYGAGHGFVHGRDVAFTYGPWSWVALPMQGQLLGAGLTWQFVMWAGFGCVVAFLFFIRKVPLMQAAGFAACVAAGSRTFSDYGYAGPDIFLSWTVLLLLVCAMEGAYWLYFFCAAILLTGVLFLIKLTSAIFAASAILAWPFGTFVLGDKAKAYRAAFAASVGIPIACLALYLAHHASFATFAQYLRAALDLSSGFSVAMSARGETDLDLQQAFFVIGAYTVLAIVLALRKQPAFTLALCAAGPLFLSFKHAFIRPVGHIEILFTTVPLLLAPVLVQIRPRNQRDRIYISAAVALVILAWFYRERLSPSFANLANAAKVADWASLTHSLATQSQASLTSDAIPGLPQVTTAVFPFEASIAAANAPLPLRPFPTVQTYAAYTARLDQWNADALDDPLRAPQQIVMHWDILDGRHPFVDSPALTLAMIKHYDFAANLPGGRVLLKRRATDVRFRTLRKSGEATLRLGEPLVLPSLLARVELRLNSQGQFRKLFWKLPESQILLSSTSGRVVAARLIPDVWPIPADLGSCPTVSPASGIS